jgi:fructose-bisphosphate aldolase class 1
MVVIVSGHLFSISADWPKLQGRLREVFRQFYSQHVTLEVLILKPNMAFPGSSSTNQEVCSALSSGSGNLNRPRV